MHSIRAKITAITIAAILTTILAVFLACNSTLQEENDRRSVEMMNLIGQTTGESLENYLGSIEQSVELVANYSVDKLNSVVIIENGGAGAAAGKAERSEEQTARLDEYIAGYCSDIQEAFNSIANQTHGVETYFFIIAPEISHAEHGFFYSSAGKTGFSEKHPLDPSSFDPDDLENGGWYYVARDRGRPSWIGPYKAEETGDRWICSYLTPVYKSGVLIGVLGVDVSADTMVTEVSAIKVYDSGYACLLNDEEIVIYHPLMETGEDVSKLGLEFIDDRITTEKNSGNELIRYTLDGEEKQMSFNTLSNGMKLVITAPTKEINAYWYRLGHVILIITVVILIVFAALVALVMRYITNPLKDLTDASQRLANADYDVKLDYKSNDEVGVLTGAFMQMRDQIKQYIDDLSRRAYTDQLTGLPNMRCFFELAEAERERLAEEGKYSAMLFFDLIGMKYYNRQYGFSEGDKLLCEIGNILKEHYGEQRICRYGDDHFAAVIDEERMIDDLPEIFMEVRNANGKRSLPVRVGIYPNSLEEVNVNAACDRAKFASEKYRDTYESGYYIFSRSMVKEIENVRYIINHLDQAIYEGWIRVYYQPIISAESGRVCDEEALSRWIDPEMGFMSPAEFIPVLEKARLIYKMDLYVLDQIIEKMKKQKAEGLTVVPHSLNLSRSDFDTCDIVDEICIRVDNADIPHEMLTIEITESMVGSDFDFMKSQVQRFQELGFKVWMDDFGSGYSTLDVLNDIHFDLLKFDMRFMQRFDEDDESKIIMTNLVQMTRELGIETVCEGVETKQQADFLREIGCTKLQGYYFCKPIPFEEIVERYRSGRQIGFEEH